MAKKERFPLEMADNAQVKSLEELREHFDLASVLRFYTNGKLLEWLSDRYYEDEADKVKSLNSSSTDFKKQLCEILGISYNETEHKECAKSIPEYKPEPVPAPELKVVVPSQLPILSAEPKKKKPKTQKTKLEKEFVSKPETDSKPKPIPKAEPKQQKHLNAAVSKDNISSDTEYQNYQQVMEKNKKFAKYKKPGIIKWFLFIVLCILLGFFVCGTIAAIIFGNSDIVGYIGMLSPIVVPILGSMLLKRRIKKSTEKHQLYVDAKLKLDSLSNER